MIAQPCWFLESSLATLRIGPLVATIDLARPVLGLNAVRYHSQPLALSLLALEAPAIAQLDGTSLLERYVQWDNLVAAYRESPSWPVRVDGRWRAAVEGPLTVLDLVVSARTPLLDSRPEMAVQSTVEATGAWRLVSADPSRFEPWSAGPGPQESPGASAGLSSSTDNTVGQANRGSPGCLLFRLPGDAWSCAAMAHPADFTRVELAAGAGEPRAFRLAYRLFAGRLEKGVILRARVRCLLLPRDSDLSLAAAHYASFMAAEPPLGL
jgi:hypothetical protein